MLNVNLKNLENQLVYVESIELLDEEDDVWDLSVPNTHTFYVGENGTLTHNCDYLGHDAMALLRALIDEAPDTCRFIATCNYINKVTPPLQSRFQAFHFNAPNVELVFERCSMILARHKIKYDEQDLLSVIDVAYPDFRKIIQLLEQNSTSGQLVLGGGEGAADWKLEIIDLLSSSDFKAIRKLVCERSSKEELQEIYKFLYEHIGKCEKIKAQDEAIVKIAEYAYRHSFMADPELNVAALMIELGALCQ